MAIGEIIPRIPCTKPAFATMLRLVLAHSVPDVSEVN